MTYFRSASFHLAKSIRDCAISLQLTKFYSWLDSEFSSLVFSAILKIFDSVEGLICLILVVLFLEPMNLLILLKLLRTVE